MDELLRRLDETIVAIFVCLSSWLNELVLPQRPGACSPLLRLAQRTRLTGVGIPGGQARNLSARRGALTPGAYLLLICHLWLVLAMHVLHDGLFSLAVGLLLLLIYVRLEPRVSSWVARQRPARRWRRCWAPPPPRC